MSCQVQAASHAAGLSSCSSSLKLVFPPLPSSSVNMELPQKKVELDTVFDVTGHLKLPAAQESTVANGLASGVGPWTGTDGGNKFKSSVQKDGSVFTIEKCANGNVIVSRTKDQKTTSTEVTPDGNFPRPSNGVAPDLK